MNVLFLTLCEYKSIYDKDLYTDLLRVFMKNGDNVYMVSPIEKRHNESTTLIKEDNSILLRLKIGNIQKTNIIEKGISTITIERIFINGIKKYFSDVKFDLVLYSTPPITLVGAVEYVKNRDNAKTYLLLKDIFPQNAVDIGILNTNGVKGILYKFFRSKEKKLYKISDKIGCMSPANAEFVIKHNPFVNSNTVEVCPNSIEIIDKKVDDKSRNLIREKYGIPKDKVVLIYGGNLGKPQGIPFFIECIKAIKDIKEIFVLVVGDGTEYELLENFSNEFNQSNFKLMKRFPKEDYDTMVGACDVGLLFLDHRFTIPNFPSRMVSYMQAHLPILACTDVNTDVGDIIVDNGFGWWCESNNSVNFEKKVEEILKTNVIDKGEISWQKLNEMYDVKEAYEIIMGDI